MLAKQFLTLEKFSGAYLITGSDAYLKKKVVDHILSFIPEGLLAFNYDVIEGGKDVLYSVINSADMIAAFADMRVVHLKNIEEKLTDESIKAFKEYLKNPNPSSVIIVSDTGGYLVSIKDSFVEIDCNPYTANEIVEFIKTRAKELGTGITHDAAKLLSEYCVRDMMRIDVELYKLSEYKDGGIINDTDIKECVHAHIEYKFYEIANAVGEKNADLALTIIKQLMYEGMSAAEVIAQLSTAFRRMLYIKLSALTSDEIAKILGVKPFAVTKMKEKLHLFTPLKLKNIYDDINDKEYKLKSGVMSPESALDSVLVKIFA